MPDVAIAAAAAVVGAVARELLAYLDGVERRRGLKRTRREDRIDLDAVGDEAERCPTCGRITL